MLFHVSLDMMLLFYLKALQFQTASFMFVYFSDICVSLIVIAFLCFYRTVIPAPEQLERRVHAVIQLFQDVADANGVPLYKPGMTDEWHLQRTHIRRGCLSDPFIHPVDDSGMYSFTKVANIILVCKFGHVEGPFLFQYVLKQ